VCRYTSAPVIHIRTTGQTVYLVSISHFSFSLCTWLISNSPSKMFLRLLPHHSRNPLWGLIQKFEKVGRNFFTTPFSLSLFSFPPGSYPYFPPLACLLFCSCARPSRLCPSDRSLSRALPQRGPLNPVWGALSL